MRDTRRGFIHPCFDILQLMTDHIDTVTQLLGLGAS